MKISEFLNNNKTEDRAADLRGKLAVPFLASVGAVLLFWIFRKACTVRTGICWYALWNAFYHIFRFAASILLIVMIVLTLYLWIYSFCSIFFSRRGPNTPVILLKWRKGSELDELDNIDLSLSPKTSSADATDDKSDDADVTDVTDDEPNNTPDTPSDDWDLDLGDLSMFD